MKEENLEGIARAALTLYEGDFTSLSYFAGEVSMVFKVTDSRYRKFALKIYDNASNLDDNFIEVLILESIRERSAISVAEIVKNREGRSITIYEDVASTTSYRIVLFKWLEGEDLRNNESPERFFQLGQLIADLHLVTKEIDIPENLAPKKWDQVFYFRDEVAVYQEKQYGSQVNSEFKALMDAAIPYLDKKLLEIYGSGKPQLLHGDLNPWNLKIHGDALALIDFEDAILGLPVHDLAILLFYYEQDERYGYALIKEKILNGYRSRSELYGPVEDQIKLLSMARNVNLLNYVLTLKRHRPKFIEQGLVKLKTFLAS